MRARGSSGQRPPERRRWWRGREVQANRAESERFLDLAGFVDGRLDNDQRERVAALIAAEPTAAADAAAARVLIAATLPAVSDEIVARAAALIGPAQPTLAGGEILAFPRRSPPPRPRAWPNAARWSGLAAAIAVACWLGFDLGGDLPGIASIAHPSDELGAAELIDAAPLALRDPSEGSSI